MGNAIRISARNVELTDAIRTDIEKHAAKLEKYSTDITGGKITVEVPNRKKDVRKLYNVKLDIKVPGKEIVVRKKQSRDLYLAVRDAFFAAYRRLENWSKRRRGIIKYHEEMPTARITALYRDEGYGFIETPDGRQLYFHENSVLKKNFSRLRVGSPVRYVEEMGEKGPQASTVVNINADRSGNAGSDVI